ncbi:hypothetical protein COLO4_30816 [Corchorus olitorius]|uniref:Uncharacterized protein n=1 Tax=Corchorus olitorius TaxID=93759 RepID=A0A1R3H6T8_9ROSI|nr:hypothetical protein COLO4_30816 [Corchorus olitorius]
MDLTSSLRLPYILTSSPALHLNPLKNCKFQAALIGFLKV